LASRKHQIAETSWEIPLDKIVSICTIQVRMKHLSTRQVAKRLGLSHAALVRYIAAGKVPAPQTLEFGGFRAHIWTEEEIEHVRQLLPKIANGRKTRYQKLREKQNKTPAGAPVPHKVKKKKK
jgi:predicted DNA-binding transcriptional regulator AlpA